MLSLIKKYIYFTILLQYTLSCPLDKHQVYSCKGEPRGKLVTQIYAVLEKFIENIFNLHDLKKKKKLRI